MSIKNNLLEVKAEIPQGVELVAISKYHPVEALQEAYDAGQRIFGESHVQELVGKEAVLPKDIIWHFIGHLQTNKVKYIAPFISLIHAVDTMKLLKEIDKQAEKAGRKINCLLQMHIAQEDTKFGFAPDELKEMLAAGEWRQYEHVQIAGLMCMATNTDDQNQIQQEFHYARTIYDDVKKAYFSDDEQFKELSMGMSSDYTIAINEGCTMVRVGSKIFGNRVYNN